MTNTNNKNGMLGLMQHREVLSEEGTSSTAFIRRPRPSEQNNVRLNTDSRENLRRFARIHKKYEYQVLDTLLQMLGEPEFERQVAARIEKTLFLKQGEY